MARFGLWVVALSLGCLIAVVTSQSVSSAPPANSSENVCSKFIDDKGTISMARVFDMIMTHYMTQVPDMGTELLREFMRYADKDRDDCLSLTECANLVLYINMRTPGKH